MILEIKLSNFYSINEEVILDLRGGNIRSQKSKELEDNVFQWKKDSILKTVVMYGANASGKSNIIKAIRFCCYTIFNSHTNNENSQFGFKPFKFSKTDTPSSFFIRFVQNKIEYEYSFTLNQNEILKESLYYYPSTRRAKIFERDETIKGDKSDKYSFGTAIKRPLDVAVNTSKKTLYISRASQMDREIGKDIFNYFNYKFILGYIGFNSQSVEHLFIENKKFLLRALQIADSDIVDITMEKQKIPVKTVGMTFTADGKDTLDVNDGISEQLKISTYHRIAPKIAFDFSEESAGTRKLFYILLNIIDIVRNDRILLIDEIEDSLHSKIVEFFIELFNKSKQSQLIFSTHNTNLLDLNKMRRDQIYFVNKNEKAASDLYSLYDYKNFRENMDAEKGYLQGRFDAVPYVDFPDSLIKQVING